MVKMVTKFTAMAGASLSVHCASISGEKTSGKNSFIIVVKTASPTEAQDET